MSNQARFRSGIRKNLFDRVDAIYHVRAWSDRSTEQEAVCFVYHTGGLFAAVGSDDRKIVALGGSEHTISTVGGRCPPGLFPGRMGHMVRALVLGAVVFLVGGVAADDKQP